MKTRIGAVLILLAVALPIGVNATGNNKVTICHVPPGNPDNAHTITISKNALKAHLGNNDQGLHGGDYYGECKVQPTPTTTPTDEPTATPTMTPTEEPTATPEASASSTQVAPTLPPTDTDE